MTARVQADGSALGDALVTGQGEDGIRRLLANIRAALARKPTTDDVILMLAVCLAAVAVVAWAIEAVLIWE
jgi:hypothetical protein